MSGSVAGGGLPGVELSQSALRNPLQHLFGENSQQLPADVQGLKHRPVVVRTWGGAEHHIIVQVKYSDNLT